MTFREVARAAYPDSRPSSPVSGMSGNETDLADQGAVVKIVYQVMGDERIDIILVSGVVFAYRNPA